MTYRLVDTWHDYRWQFKPGQVYDPIDISTAPDGRLYLLDFRPNGTLVQIFDAEGTPEQAISLPPTGYAFALDAAHDGTFYVLRNDHHTPEISIVEHFDLEGKLISSKNLFHDSYHEYSDISVGPDEHVYLTLNERGDKEPKSLSKLEVLDSQLRFVTSIGANAIIPDDPTNPIVLRLLRVDVDYKNNIHLAVRPYKCGDAGPPTPPPTVEPPSSTDMTVASSASAPRGIFEPRAAPRPAKSSATGFRPTPASLAQSEAIPITIDTRAVTLDPEYRVIAAYEMPANLNDIAAGHQTVGVIGARRVVALEDGAVRTAWLPPRQTGDPNLPIQYGLGRVAIGPDNSLYAGYQNCELTGILRIRPPWQGSGGELLTVTDRPLLEGPLYPVRLSAGRYVLVQQGHLWRPNPPYWRGREDWPRLAEPVGQSEGVQRWSLDGRLLDQWNRCGCDDVGDIASEGDHVYLIHWRYVAYRPDNRPALWKEPLGAGDSQDDSLRMIAGHAAGDVLAALDVARREVLVFSSRGLLLHRWSWHDLDSRAVPVDIATDGQNVFLADVARQAVLIADLAEGRLRGRLPLHDPPRAIDLGPMGDLFVLGAGGWVMRYSQGGALVAHWALPVDRREGIDATDLAVGDDERVYVSFTGLELDPQGAAPLIVHNGIWVFEPSPLATGTPPKPPEVGGCLPRAHKWASPQRLPLGSEVGVTLHLGGSCPKRPQPYQVVIVLDTSRSMSWSNSLWRAQRTLVALLQNLDPTVGQVGLVTFSDHAQIGAPLTDQIGAIRSRLLTARATGDTFLGLAIELARAELTSVRRNPACEPFVVVATDGQFHDQPESVIARAKADGMRFLVLVYPNTVPEQEVRTPLEAVFGPDVPLYFDLLPEHVGKVVDTVLRHVTVHGLFEQVSVVDEVAPGMELVADSIEPPATSTADRLTWDFPSLTAAQGVTMTYRLRPLTIGQQTTNNRAWAAYRDVLGHEGLVYFPQPMVEVIPPTATPTPEPTATPSPRPRAYVPIALREPTPRRQPTDLVIVLDTSTSMSGKRLAAAKATIRSLLTVADLTDSRVALVAFNSDVRRVVGWTHDPLVILEAVDEADVAVGTRIDIGLRAAAELVGQREARSARAPVLLLISDGQHIGDPQDAIRAAASTRRAGVTIFAIHLGDESYLHFLEQLTGDPRRVFGDPSSRDLQDIYDALVPLEGCNPEEWWLGHCP